jgi:hypothetical protein
VSENFSDTIPLSAMQAPGGRLRPKLRLGNGNWHWKGEIPIERLDSRQPGVHWPIIGTASREAV